MAEQMIAVLGDSRAFDTYYYNSLYSGFYGYDKTFPFLLRRRILLGTGGRVDVSHIPDHFRGGTVENNILRIAMNNPDVVILCNGLWETLVSKKHFLEYATNALEKHATLSGKTLDLKYSSSILAQLFVENKLSNSPNRFRDRERRIISYFRRRQRQCIYMNLTVPNRNHINRIHYAGNYRCIPEWDICLKAMNDAIDNIAKSYGTYVLDTNLLMEQNGGPSECLIDQWHYSVYFHEIIADRLDTMIHDILEKHEIGDDHEPNEYMVSGVKSEGALAVYGTGAHSAEWIVGHPKLHVEAVIEEIPASSSFYSIPVICEKDIANIQSSAILLLVSEEDRERVETRLLRRIDGNKVIVYPEELEEIWNPIPEKTVAEG